MADTNEPGLAETQAAGETAVPTEVFDLTAVDGNIADQEDGTVVKIMHPVSGKDTGIWIKIAGPDSKRARAARNASLAARVKKRKMKTPTGEELDEESCNVLAGQIIEWGGVILNGKVIPYSLANAIMLLQRYNFIRQDLEAVAGDRTGFTKS